MSRYDQRITIEQEPSPRKAIACICVAPDAFECAAIRHEDYRPLDEQEPCSCICHEEPEDDGA